MTNYSRLYQKYLELVQFELDVLDVRPTELRHLIGRLGEFYAANKTGGELSKEVNQHGFDVIGSNGRKISVKTTAQKKGFISINPNTLDKVDDLMLLQFDGQELVVVYHGSIKAAVEVARLWNGKYELDISKAASLVSAIAEFKI